MKTKIVYCVSSTNEDIYIEQLAVSLYSLKKNSPESKTVVAMDTITYNSLNEARKRLLCLADEVLPIDVGEGSGYVRSRMIRTTIRQHIVGPIFVIDSDTIILRPLYELDEITSDIAAVQDANLNGFSNLHPTYNRCVYHCNKYFNFQLQSEPKYFSGGAIFSNDTNFAHKFYEKWNELFLKGHTLGVAGDQQSLAFANFQLGRPIVELSGIWNCQLSYGVRFMPQSKVLHYFAWINQNDKSGNYSNPLNDPKTYESIKQTGEISKQVKTIVENVYMIFSPKTCMMEGESYDIVHTKTFMLFLHLYRSKSLFKILENISNFIYKFKSNKSNVKL